MNPMEDPLHSLLAEYRDACPDPEPSAQFMPQLWQRIEASRNSTVSLLLRRWAEVWLVATVAMAIVTGALLIPSYQNQQTYQASYLDLLAAADSASDVLLVPVSDSE
jgi:anti-sigma-K factor RskA